MKRLFAWNRFSAALALLFPISGVAQTNLMVNGSFELPAITDSSQQTTAVATPTGWTVGTGVGVLVNPPYNYFPEAQNGSQLYYIGDGGSHASIQQSVALSAGQSYQLSFYLAPLIGSSWVSAGWDAKVDLTISDGTQTLLPGLDYSYTVATSVQGWEQKSYSFTAANSSSYTFTFTTQGGGTDAASIDNVVLTAVPEPSTYAAIFGVCALGFVAYRRHRRKKAD